MTELESSGTIEALISAINAKDLAAMDRLFADDVVMEWPQSGERIRGNANRREVYARFPGLPTVTPSRLMTHRDLCVLEAKLDYGDGEPYLAVFIFELRAGLIEKEVAYWSKPFPAPEWRSPWVERM